MQHTLGILTLALALAAAGCSGDSKPSASYELAAQGVYAAALSSGSELALVGSLNHGGSLWNTGSYARVFNWNHRAGEFSELVAAEFSPDGTRAVTTDPRTLVVWDTRSGDALAFWTTPSAALDVAIANDGRVLMGLEDHSAVVFDADSGAHLETLLHEGVVGSVALSADARWALTGSDGRDRGAVERRQPARLCTGSCRTIRSAWSPCPPRAVTPSPPARDASRPSTTAPAASG